MHLLRRLIHHLLPTKTEYDRCGQDGCEALNLVPEDAAFFRCWRCGSSFLRTERIALRVSK